MAQGNGAVRGGDVLAGVARPQPAPVLPRPVVAPSPPEALPLAQLGKRPVPPALERALRQNYPARARRQGLGGEAKVRARIEPTGQVRTATIHSESSPGFGEACQRTLLTSRWSPPVDARGRPVATWVSYRCKFRIDD
jgi:protein TonB